MRPKESRYCVLIPVINEGERIRNQLRWMRDLELGLDVIIADGGSTDGSLDPELLAETGVSALLVKAGPGRLSAQLRMGFAYALDRGYDGVIAVDGNGKDGLDAIPRFVDRLLEGYDFVQGSRYVKGGVAINTPLDRTLAVRLIHAPLISLAAGFWYTDTTNGFRAFSAKLLRDPQVALFRDVFANYNLHYYLAIRAARLGFRVCEVPVLRAYPEKAKTPTKISGLRGRLLILKELVLSVIGAYNLRSGANR
jgi:glycosyltransferase involved in cell wall biosynthesis